MSEKSETECSRSSSIVFDSSDNEPFTAMFPPNGGPYNYCPTVVYDSEDMAPFISRFPHSPPEQSTSSTAQSNEPTPRKRRMCFDNVDKKMQKARDREDGQDRILCGNRGTISRYDGSNVLLQVSCVLFGHCRVIVLLLSY